MMEDEAKAWVAERFGDHAVDRVAAFVALVIAENDGQNLIAPSTVSTIWARHVVDSAQLITLARTWSSWIDIGTGGGFPGMIVALLVDSGTVTMVEPRRKRAVFLDDCVKALGLRNAVVRQTKIEAINAPADVISARAVGAIDQLLHAAAGCATKATTWLLPRGELKASDHAVLASLKATMFHVEHSITGSNSTIVVLKGSGR